MRGYTEMTQATATPTLQTTLKFNDLVTYANDNSTLSNVEFEFEGEDRVVIPSAISVTVTTTGERLLKIDYSDSVHSYFSGVGVSGYRMVRESNYLNGIRAIGTITKQRRGRGED